MHLGLTWRLDDRVRLSEGFCSHHCYSKGAIFLSECIQRIDNHTTLKVVWPLLHKSRRQQTSITSSDQEFRDVYRKAT